MVVLATADPYGGVLTYAAQLARGCGARGVRTVLAVFGRPLSRAQREALDPAVEVFEAPFRLEWMDDPWDDLPRSVDWLAGLAEQVRPDVLHLNTYAHAAVPVDAPRVVVAHSCVGSWWRAVHGAEMPARYDRYRALVRDGLRAADVVVAPTAAFAGEVRALYGARPVVVPNATAAAPHPVGPRDPVVLAAGRLWDPAKNLQVLDRVAERLAWPVRVAGEGVGPDGAAVGPGAALRLGPLDAEQLRAEMCRASVFCHPARYEPFGLAPLEAARRGCALVLGDLPTLREVWGDAAAYAPPDDPDAIAAALAALLGDPVRRRRAARAAQDRAARLGVDRQVDEMVRLYTQILRSPR